MRNVILFILLIVFDYFSLTWFVHELNPEPSSSLLLVVYIPALVVMNLLVFGILAYLSKRYSWIFFVNAIISPVLMHFIFGKALDTYRQERWAEWTFENEDTQFIITHSIIDSIYSITYRMQPESPRQYMSGELRRIGDTVYMNDDMEIFILNDILFNFKFKGDTIHLINIVR